MFNGIVSTLAVSIRSGIVLSIVAAVVPSARAQESTPCPDQRGSGVVSDHDNARPRECEHARGFRWKHSRVVWPGRAAYGRRGDCGIQAKLETALRGISRSPVKYAINTHWHWDHTDGNGWVPNAAPPVPSNSPTKPSMRPNARAVTV